MQHINNNYNVLQMVFLLINTYMLEYTVHTNNLPLCHTVKWRLLTLSAVLYRTECKKGVQPLIIKLLHLVRKQLKSQCHPLTKGRTYGAQ